MFAVSVTLKIKAGCFNSFLPLIKKQAENSLSLEPDCLQFDVCYDQEHENQILLYELYTSSETFALHLESEHFKQFDDAIADLIEKKTVKTFKTVFKG